MTVDELYDYITKQMSPEQALKNFLATSIEQYELMLDKPNEGGSPILVITAACHELGWSFKVKDEEYVNGLICGNESFMERAMVVDEN